MNPQDYLIENGVLSGYRGSSRDLTVPDGVTEIAARVWLGCRSLQWPPAALSSVPIRMKQALVFGFAADPSAYSPQRRAEYIRYLASQRRKLLPAAVAADFVAVFSACEAFGVAIPPALRDELISQAAAEGRHGVLSWLMDYKERTADRAREEKARLRLAEKQLSAPFSPSLLRRDWRWLAQPDGTICLTGYRGRDAQVVIPPFIGIAPVTRIGAEAFRGCSGVQSVVIPQGVTSVDSFAFTGCSKLEMISIPDSVTQISRLAFFGTPWAAAQGSWLIVNGLLLEYRGNDVDVTVPTGVKYIGDSAFRKCSFLQRVTLPQGVEHIGAHAFACCLHLQRISLPQSLKSIGGKAFMACTALEDLRIPAGVTDVAFNAFDHTAWSKGCGDFIIVGDTLLRYRGSQRNVVIPQGVSRIGDHAFLACGSMERLVIPSGVTAIGRAAFRGCRKLQRVSLPDGLIHIGDSAFRRCSSLHTINLPDSLVAMGRYVFLGCGRLETAAGSERVLTLARQQQAWLRTLAGVTAASAGRLRHFRNADHFRSTVMEAAGLHARTINSNVTWLVTNHPDAADGKTAAARALNIPMISEDAFIARYFPEGIPE